MAESEDWLLRPCVEGLCRYESLKDCTLDLEDVSRMNEAIEVNAENDLKYRRANED